LEANVFKGEFIQCKQLAESVQNIMVLLSKVNARANVNPSLVPITHAASSKKLTDSVFVCVSLDFAVIGVTAIQ
jgi:hypothetical protein